MQKRSDLKLGLLILRDVPYTREMKRLNLETGAEKRGGEIVLATPEDALAIVRIQAASWLATYPNEQYGITSEDIEAKKLDSLARFDRWKKTIEESGIDYQVWVAKESGSVVGYCLASRGKEENEIGALYLLPEAQGRGIGQKLMEEALAWLGDEKKIGLGVAIYNDRAIRFYKGFGFQESNEAPHPIPPLPSGKRMPIVKMEKLPR